MANPTRFMGDDGKWAWSFSDEKEVIVVVPKTKEEKEKDLVDDAIKEVEEATIAVKKLKRSRKKNKKE